MCDDPEDIVLIDGNNLCYRVFWVHRHLTHNSKPVSLLYGFLKSLIALRKKYPKDLFIIGWDSKSARRIAESKEGVAKGIIASSYKSNRDGDSNNREELEDMFDQMSELKEILDHTKCQQVYAKGFEADDVLYTYAKKNYANGGRTLIVTSDHDYYQVLHDDIVVFDAMNSKTWTKESFEEEYGLKPSQWVEYGALAGDSSDNIISPDGWAEGTAMKYMKEFGSIENIIAHLRNKRRRHAELTAQYNRYKENRHPYDKITKKAVNEFKLSQKEETLLNQIPRLELAKSLKKMDIVPNLPDFDIEGACDKNSITEVILKYKFVSLLKDVKRLV